MSPTGTNTLDLISSVDQMPENKSVPLPDQRSPQALNADSHNAKMARMEATASQGFGGGIPAKIEEGVEPGDTQMRPPPLF